MQVAFPERTDTLTKINFAQNFKFIKNLIKFIISHTILNLPQNKILHGGTCWKDKRIWRDDAHDGMT